MFRLFDWFKEYTTDPGIFKQMDMINNVLTRSFLIMVMNHDGKVIDLNEKFIGTFQYSLAELYLEDFKILNTGYHSELFLLDFWHTVRNGKTWSGELCFHAKNREVIWLNSTCIPIHNPNGNIAQYILFSTDVSAQKEMQKWRHLASHNDLTNLPNRRMLADSMKLAIEKVKENQKQIAFLYMDIDHFKNINDNYGHSVGDLFLRQVGNRLSNADIPNDSVFHLSGDEFFLIIEDVEKLESFVHAITNQFNKPFLIDKHRIHATVSIGMSVFPNHSEDPLKLIKYADLAMFEAKKNDGNTFCSYEECRIRPH